MVIKEKLQNIVDHIESIAGKDAVSRAFVDSSVLTEKAWAQRAGLGWQGKHSVHIHPVHGSFCFIGIILTTLELDYNEPAADRCGDCNLCMEACPTGAIVEPCVLDARKCISYNT